MSLPLTSSIPQIVSLLLQHNANPLLKNKSGKVPHQIVENEHIREMLFKATSNLAIGGGGGGGGGGGVGSGSGGGSGEGEKEDGDPLAGYNSQEMVPKCTLLSGLPTKLLKFNWDYC